VVVAIVTVTAPAIGHSSEGSTSGSELGDAGREDETMAPHARAALSAVMSVAAIVLACVVEGAKRW
jgi:hypothetical protein